MLVVTDEQEKILFKLGEKKNFLIRDLKKLKKDKTQNMDNVKMKLILQSKPKIKKSISLLPS